MKIICVCPVLRQSVDPMGSHAIAVILGKSSNKDDEPLLIVTDSNNINLGAINKYNPWHRRSYGRSLNYALKHISKAYANA